MQPRYCQKGKIIFLVGFSVVKTLAVPEETTNSFRKFSNWQENVHIAWILDEK